jgi:hypothetical protein
MKTLLILFSALLAVFFIQGCTPQGATMKETSYVPTFKYSPPTTSAPASANVTFAIVNATYSENQPWTSQSPFNDFSRNMALDFQELLAARGFTVKGPFSSYDELAYPDKKGSDLVLQPSLEVKLDESNMKVHEQVNLLGPNTFYYEGSIVISGRVTLSLMEPLSKERMWFKSVEIPRTVVACKSAYATVQYPVAVNYSDKGIATSLGKSMEAVYKKVMEAAWKYLDPGEMAIVKKQADEIKAKKVY